MNYSEQSAWSQVCVSSGYLGDSVAVLQVGGFRETLRLVNQMFPTFKKIIYLFFLETGLLCVSLAALELTA